MSKQPLDDLEKYIKVNGFFLNSVARAESSLFIGSSLKPQGCFVVGLREFKAKTKKGVRRSRSQWVIDTRVQR
jgi:hypothetical protein